MNESTKTVEDQKVCDEDEVVDIYQFTMEILSKECPGMNPTIMGHTAVYLINKATIEMKNREELRNKEVGPQQKANEAQQVNGNAVRNRKLFSIPSNKTPPAPQTKLEVIDEEGLESRETDHSLHTCQSQDTIQNDNFHHIGNFNVPPPTMVAPGYHIKDPRVYTKSAVF